jgi:arylsulfatase A
VPFLARWPGHVPAGKVSNELICHVDLLGTVAALIEKPLAKDAGPDSFNILPALTAEKPAKPCRASLVHQSGNPQALAIRKGDWKLIPNDAAKKKIGPELFNLKDDPTEMKNFAAANPEKVKELAELLQEIQKQPASRP